MTLEARYASMTRFALPGPRAAIYGCWTPEHIVSMNCLIFGRAAKLARAWRGEWAQ